MKMDKLDQFIKDNRPLFDDAEVPSYIWQEIQTQLRNDRRKKNLFWATLKQDLLKSHTKRMPCER